MPKGDPPAEDTSQGAAWIGHQVGLAASTVQAILNRAWLGRLDRGDRATNSEPVRRYQREHPGELIHVDIKKLAAIPPGGGWRMHGKGRDGHGGHSGAGYVYLHSAIDDRTRIVDSEIHRDEQGVTAAGFWRRAAAYYASLGITCERVITDNGACYRSRLWHQACAATNAIPFMFSTRRLADDVSCIGFSEPCLDGPPRAAK